MVEDFQRHLSGPGEVSASAQKQEVRLEETTALDAAEESPTPPLVGGSALEPTWSLFVTEGHSTSPAGTSIHLTLDYAISTTRQETSKSCFLVSLGIR
ncbi:zinc finger protein with KRAB and SCAN domains 7 isoform X2 [Fukomys damarensis]|uniref:zinc finger protein with KRAB and SCAN domains 7 isoform X2 n=1 Tax=Fukomys damarensis TaxID=885580 RepID=UPI0008FEC133|nr:zinc finger protein with KRAB and SCAN domains 7 isoform X2 [Fukomys damarensis]